MTRTYLAAAAALTLLTACNGTTGPVSGNYVSLPADNVIVGMEHQMSNAGIRSAHLKADTALVFNDSATYKLRKVDLELYTENGTVRAELTSESGELDPNTNLMVARGNVVLVVKGTNAQTIYTEELHYDPSPGQKRIWSDVQTVRVMANGSRSTVDSFSADDQFENFRATGLRGAAPIDVRF